MYALPPVPPVTIEQQVRYEDLTNFENRRINTLSGKRYKEYAKITFLIQSHFMIRLATNDFHTIADANFIKQAWKSYFAYLKYSK